MLSTLHEPMYGLKIWTCWLLLAALVGVASPTHAQMEFVQNKGQWPDQVLARVTVGAGAIYVEDDALTYKLVDQEWADAQHPGVPDGSVPYKAHVYRMELIGSQPPTFSQPRPKPAYQNFFLGSDSTKWAARCTVSERAHAAGVYPNIDLQVYSRAQSLKYDFKVRPGGAVADIAFQYNGVDGLSLSAGRLALETCLGTVYELEPYAYQLIDGKLKDVECAYVLQDGVVTFEVGDYDPAHTLTIDPEVVFASYIGSVSYNFGFTAANDSEGNLIAGAIVFGNDYPTTTGAVLTDYDGTFGNYCDAAISKFSADGSTLMYSTFLGGGRPEMPHSVVCDSEDNWIVMGNTGSQNFPTTTGVYQPFHAGGPLMTYASFFFASATCPEGVDMFVSKFSADGTGFEASTYIGGSQTDGLNGGDMLLYNYGDCFRGEVIVDPNDRILVCSTTSSADFPVEGSTPLPDYGGGDFDGIAFRMSSDLSDLEWTAYLGGGIADSGYSIQIAESGNIVCAGGTRSLDFPVGPGGYQTTHGGLVDGYIMMFSPDGGALEAGTFVGNAAYNQNYFVQLNIDDEVFVYGQTEGELPVSASVYSNPGSGQFIQKYGSDLSTLAWTTTVGTGSNLVDISPTAFLVSDCDQIYFTGWGGETNSGNSPYAFSSSTVGMPTTPDAPQTATDGSDFYMGVLSQDAEDLVFGTFLGGGISNEHVDGGTAKFDKGGAVYQAVCAGCGGNSDFPTTPGAYSTNNGSTHCNLAVFKFDLGILQAEIDIDGPDQVCEGTVVELENNSIGGTVYDWTFGDGGESDDFEPGYEYDSNGTFEIQLIVSDEYDCLPADTAYLTIEILPGVDPQATSPDPICEGESVTLSGTGSDNLYWADDPTLSDPNIPNPVATPVEPTTYYLIDSNECETDTVEVDVSFVIPDVDVGSDATICIGQSTPVFANGAISVEWSPPEVVDNPFATSTTATPSETLTLYVDYVSVEGCTFSDSVQVQVDSDLPGGQVYDPVSVCFGESVLLEAESGIAWSWSPPEGLSATGIQNPAASPSDTTTYFVEVTNACGSGTSEVTVNVIVPTVEAGTDGAICLGQWHPVWASDAVSWSWSPLGAVADPQAQFTSVSPSNSTTFTVTATDIYGCTATDNVYVEVLPLPEVNISDPGPVYWLDSAQLAGYTATGEYEWSSEGTLTCTDCEDPVVTPDEPVWVYLETTDALGCTGRDSLLIELIYPIYVPNAFTPDNDGINDVFFASGEGITGFDMKIIDRWGNLVFHSTDINQVWDGSFQGGTHYVQNDVYVWIIEYDSRAGRARLEGHVTLVR